VDVNADVVLVIWRGRDHCSVTHFQSPLRSVTR
jgi:hypothetical protein